MTKIRIVAFVTVIFSGLLALAAWQQIFYAEDKREVVLRAFEKAIEFLNEKYIEHYQEKGALTQEVRKRLETTKTQLRANLGKAAFGPTFTNHVVALPVGAPLVMLIPAYIKLGSDTATSRGSRVQAIFVAH